VFLQNPEGLTITVLRTTIWSHFIDA